MFAAVPARVESMFGTSAVTVTFSVTDAKGTKRTTITGLPGGITRRITTWKAGGALMTHTRDYDAKGKLVKQQRIANKAK